MNMSTSSVPMRTIKNHSLGDWFSQHWFPVFLGIYGLWVWLPWLAPISMQVGWTGLGRTIYLIYSFFCHQLPERSFFLFGGKTMYSVNEIQAAWKDTLNPLILRQFIGNDVMGWKVAWSDRMVSFYTSVWIFALAWWPFRRKLKPLSWWGFALLLFPIALDGGTHMISDIAGIGNGFRDSNAWLATLTNHLLPASFYAGDALGSFNSWMRLLTGPLAGLALAWLVLPYFFQEQALNQELDRLNYGKVLEQIQSQDPRSAG